MAHHILEIYAKGGNGKDVMRDQFLQVFAVCYGTGHHLHTYRFMHNKDNGVFLDLEAGISDMCWGTLKVTGMQRITDMCSSQFRNALQQEINNIYHERRKAA